MNIPLDYLIALNRCYDDAMTLKQDKALDNMVENGGNVSKAMRDAGYSENTAKTPQKLTSSKAFKSKMTTLMRKSGVTKEQFFQNVGDAMKAMKMHNFTGEITPDYTTRLAANKQAEKYLFMEEERPPAEPIVLEGFPAGVDEVELQRILFKGRAN